MSAHNLKYNSILILALVLMLGGSPIILEAANSVELVPPEQIDSETPAPIGRGDGRIHVIPTLSAPSVKNGGKLTISAVVKALAGVREVKAEIRDGERVIDTLTLGPAPSNLAGVGTFGSAGGTGAGAFVGQSVANVGLWTAEWNAHGLEEKFYSVRLRVTDVSGHRFEDDSLRFSDPIAGISTPGSTSYPNGFAEFGSVGFSSGENDPLTVVLDAAAGYG